MEERKRTGRPPKAVKVKGAGISLYPQEIAALDLLMTRFGLESRAQVVRRLLRDHPETQKAQAA